MQEILRTMQKGELHVHLNGLVDTELVTSLLKAEGVEIPLGFDLNSDLTRTAPSPDLISYLKPWQVLRLIPRSRVSLRLIVDNAFKNLKKQNVTFVELRNSVIYIAQLNNIGISTALFWLIQEIKAASEKYSIKSGLILTIPRGDKALDHLNALLKSYIDLERPSIIVGLDLAGDEDAISPEHTGKAFCKAKDDFGLNVTIHAGETGNPEHISDAIVNFNADRIGHGTAAYKSHVVMDLLRNRDVCVEVCPISNRRTGAVSSDESHPVSEFIKMEVPFVICSDNPSIHRASLSDDYLEFYRETHNIEIIRDMLSLQIKYSFIKGLT